MSTKLADKLYPVSELEPAYREQLVQKGSTLVLRPGEKYNGAQAHRWLLYLLSGKLTLFGADTPTIIEAATERAHSPVFGENSLKEHIVAIYACRFLRLDRNFYETLRQEQSQAGYEVRELLLDENEGIVFDQVYQAYLDKKIKLPSLPEIAVKIRLLTNDPTINSARLARLIQTDPGTAGILLHAANSAMYTGLYPVTHIRDAIVRLGLEKTRTLIFTTAMRHVFKGKSELFKHYLHQLWDRSVHISALSYVIARHCHGFDPERAMLAGLISDVGQLPILNYLDEAQLEPSEEELLKILAKLQAPIGEIVIRYWGLEHSIATVVRESSDWRRQTDNDKADYCDIVLVAKLYPYAPPLAGTDETPRYDQVPAFNRLPLGIPDETLKLKLLEEAREELDGVMRMLKTGHSQTNTPAKPAPPLQTPSAQPAPASDSTLVASRTLPPANLPAATHLPAPRASRQAGANEAPPLRAKSLRHTEIPLQVAPPSVRPDTQDADAHPARQTLVLHPSWLGGWGFFLTGLGGLWLTISGLLAQAPLTAWLANAALPAFLSIIPLLLGVAILLASAGLLSVLRYRQRYHITPHGIEVRNGLLRVQRLHIPAKHIRGVSIQQSTVQRWLGLGNLEFDNGNHASSIRFCDIPNPAQARRRIHQCLRQQGQTQPAEPV